MSDILCVTSRELCRDNFLDRLEKIAAGGITGVILREKDLKSGEYQALAERVMPICQRHDVPCILHGDPAAAEAVGAAAIHLPLPVLRTLSQQRRERFRVLGTSCHSVEEAKEAERLGCTYLIAGHIFATDCKKGLEPRGLAFLHAVCQSVGIPVWAIGGIRPENIGEVLSAGARGGCVMSGLMTCKDPRELLKMFQRQSCASI